MRFFVKRVAPFLLFITLAFAVSCNEQPTQISSVLIEDTLKLFPLSSKTTTLLVKTNSKRINLGQTFNKGVLFVGNGFGAKAVSFVRFTFPDSTYAYLEESNISQVFMTLQPERYSFGDSLGIQSFSLREVQMPYTVETTWDSIFSPDGSTNFYTLEEYGNFNGSIELKDTMPGISIPLSKELMVKWLKDTTTSGYSDALALVPDDNSQTISRFKGLETGKGEDQGNPEITILFTNNENNPDTLKLKSSIDTYYAKTPEPTNLDDIIMQGVDFYRGQLEFDLGAIPPLSAIHKAQLEIYIKPGENIVSNMGVDSVIFSGLYEDIDGISPDIPYFALREAGTDRYEFPSITSSVERWNRSGETKGTLTFIFTRQGVEIQEFKNLDRFVFHGLNAPDSLKPALKIIYSKRDR